MGKNNLTNNLKVAIIGCGRMAEKHLEKITPLVHFDKIALCDKEIIKAQVLGELYGINIFYDSLDALIKEFRADVYHIVTPPTIHKSTAIKCMESGGHVYIEKPICLNTKEFDELNDTANKLNKLFCAGHQKLFEKQYLNVKKLLQSGKLGQIIHVSAYDSGPYLQMEDQGVGNTWGRQLMGGMFFDLIPHPIGIFCDLIANLKCNSSIIRLEADNRPSELYAMYVSGSSISTCSLHISFTTKLFQNYIQIECEKGFVFINLKNKFYYVLRKSSLPDLVERASQNFILASKIIWGNSLSIFSLLTGKYDPYEGVGELIEKFYHAVSENSKSPLSETDIRNTVQLCERTIQFAFDKIPTDYYAKKTGLTSDLISLECQRLNDADYLVTGATGFIGKHLVRRLLKTGKKVRVVSRKAIPTNYFGVDSKDLLQIFVCDIIDRESINQICQGVRCVYHLAAATKGDLFTHIEATIVGTKNLLRAIKNSKVNKLVYVSSVSILNQTKYPKEGSIDDEFPYEPQPIKRGHYTYSKLKAEKLVLDFSNENDLETIIIRPGIVWGQGKEQILLETNIRLFNRTYIVLGQRKKSLPLIYVENLVDALINAGDVLKSLDHPINIVDQEIPSQGEYLKILKTVTGKRHSAIFVPVTAVLPFFKLFEKLLGIMLRKKLYISYQFRSKTNRANYSTAYLEDKLNWKSRINFFEGLRKYYS